MHKYYNNNFPPLFHKINFTFLLQASLTTCQEVLGGGRATLTTQQYGVETVAPSFLLNWRNSSQKFVKNLTKQIRDHLQILVKVKH